MNNEEKILTMLEALVQGQAELRNDVAGLRNDITGLKQGQAKLENAVLRIENVHGDKLSALFDGYSQLYDISQEIRENVVSLKGKQDKHDFELKWLYAQRKAE